METLVLLRQRSRAVIVSQVSASEPEGSHSATSRPLAPLTPKEIEELADDLFVTTREMRLLLTDMMKMTDRVTNAVVLLIKLVTELNKSR